MAILFSGGLVIGGYIRDLPAFIREPLTTTVNEGELAVFSCEVDGGVLPYTYQWYYDNIPTGDNNTYLSILSALSDNGKGVFVEVEDSIGNIIRSSIAILNVIPSTNYSFLFKNQFIWS